MCNNSDQQTGVGILEASECVCWGSRDQEKRSPNYMKQVLKGYAGQRCQLGLFCAGNGMKQGHPVVKVNFKQQLSHTGCCCVAEDDDCLMKCWVRHCLA